MNRTGALLGIAVYAAASTGFCAELSSGDGDLAFTLSPPAASVCVRWPLAAKTECSGNFAAEDAQAAAAPDRVVSSAVVRHLDWTYAVVVTREPYALGRELAQPDAQRLLQETRDEWAASGGVPLSLTTATPASGTKAFVASVDGVDSHDRVFVTAAGKSLFVVAFHLPNEPTRAQELDEEAAETMRSCVARPAVAGAAERAVVDLGWWARRATAMTVLIIAVGPWLTVLWKRRASTTDK